VLHPAGGVFGGVSIEWRESGSASAMLSHVRLLPYTETFPNAQLLATFRQSLICEWRLDCRRTEFMRHVLSALVTNQPGVLAHISGMLASRAFNIDSLAVGETENPEFSRVTFVVNGDGHVLDQVRKQLEKIVTVVKVLNFSNCNFVERDLMLIKVSTNSGVTTGTGNGSRGEIRELVEIFRGKIVDVSRGHVMVEISGQERKLESFIDLVRPYGIIEMVRTGRVALLRADQDEESEESSEQLAGDMDETESESESESS
jgi:acetolactate synthase-1/3 small subunit